MKKPLLLLAALASLSVVVPEAVAGGPNRWRGTDRYEPSWNYNHRHDHGYDRSVRRVVYRKVMVGRERDGCPIYRWVPVRTGGRGSYRSCD